MPYIETKTTRKIGKGESDALKKRLGEAIKIIPGKTEEWLMLSFEGECDMAFAGFSGDAAMISVDILGHTEDSVYAALTEKICEIVSDVLSLPKGRIYIKYSEHDRWGWNGINF